MSVEDQNIHFKLTSGSVVDEVFRFGCSYAQPAKDGSPAWLIDLYQRKAIVTGRALGCDVPSFPPVDSLVQIRGSVLRDGPDAFIWVRKLDVVAVPGSDVCVFDLALPQWVVDGSVIDRALQLWSSLGSDYREFVNAVFVQPRVLRGFLCAPGSVRHHHAYDGGCIEHSVELGELADVIATRNRNINRDRLVTGALIHDCGKSIEYVRTRSGRWRLGRYGRSVGHKIGGIQLATLAMTRCPAFASDRKEALLHMLAASYAPAWAGFRSPFSAEAVLLSAIDRVGAETGRSQPKPLP